jgi:hypothetical protein
MPWKFGFPNDAWSYKKRDRYKRNLDTIEEKMNTMFETKFRSYMQNLRQERQLELQQANQNLSLPPLLNSISSTIALHTWYPVDGIMGDTTCWLHIPLHRVRNKIKDVAIGVVMMGRVFTTIPFQQNMLRCWFVRSLAYHILIIHWTMPHLRESRSLEKLLISSYYGTSVKLS